MDNQPLANGFDRLPPHSIEAEICLLGSLALAGDDHSIMAQAMQIVTRDDFYQTDDQIVFDTLVRLHNQHRPIDALILREELIRAGVWEDIGGREYFATIIGAAPSAAHFKHYATIVHEKALLRQLISACNEGIRRAYAPRAGDLDAEVPGEIAAMADRLKTIATGAPSVLRAIPAGQLVDENPEQLKPTIDGIARYSEVMNLIAPSKARKSWLVLSLLLCFVARRAWLNMFPTTGGRALLIDNELHPSTISYRIKEVARGLGITSEEWRDAFDVVSLRSQLVNIDKLEMEFRKIERGKFGLIILDAGYKFYQDWMDENSNSHMTKFYCALERCADITGATVCLVHHAPKGNTSAREVAAIGAGAGAASRSADSIFAMREHEEADCFVIDSVLRSFPPVKPFGVRWEYPIWKADPLLDPTRLKRDPSKGGRPKKDAGKQDKPEPIDWTPERFAAEFVNGTPRTREAIESAANRQGIAFRAVAGLIAESEEKNLIYLHRKPGCNAKFYSVNRPDLFEGAQGVSLSHTPPVPPRDKRRKERRNPGN